MTESQANAIDEIIKHAPNDGSISAEYILFRNKVLEIEDINDALQILKGLGLINFLGIGKTVTYFYLNEKGLRFKTTLKSIRDLA